MTCEDREGAVQVMSLSKHQAWTLPEAKQLIMDGLNQRALGSTKANTQSSRSHAILQIRILNGQKMITFVDLAGSERGVDRADLVIAKPSSSNNNTTSGRRSSLITPIDAAMDRDGAEINKSLLALKECIRALDQGLSHVPFRQSKLTQVPEKIDIFLHYLEST